MTENEAIEKLNMLDEALNFQRHDADECSCALQMAIQALEESQAYRAIGTVKDFKNAVEIIRPRKPYKGSFGTILCSLCGEKVGQMVTKTNKADCMNFCANCGSMIDWSE